jgi:hypothetical protein
VSGLLLDRAGAEYAVTGLVYLIDDEGRIAALTADQYLALSASVLDAHTCRMTLEGAREAAAERKGRS